MARYKATDYIRRNKRQIITTAMPDDESELGTANIMHCAATAFENDAELEHALQLLSPRDRQLIELSKLQELSLLTIAEQTRLSLAAVKVGIHRAFKRLKAATSAQSDDEGSN